MIEAKLWKAFGKFVRRTSYVTSKEIACAACVSDHLQFLQDVRRHRLPIESRRHNGRNTYDLVSFTVALIVGELREYGISLSNCGRLLRRVDLDLLGHRVAKIALDEIDCLIALIPQRDDFDEEFPTSVTSWTEAFQYAQNENINFIFVPLHDLLRGKLQGHW
jgi:hypothetical protein